jgi:hypothetical protein
MVAATQGNKFDARYYKPSWTLVVLILGVLLIAGGTVVGLYWETPVGQRGSLIMPALNGIRWFSVTVFSALAARWGYQAKQNTNGGLDERIATQVDAVLSSRGLGTDGAESPERK